MSKFPEYPESHDDAYALAYFDEEPIDSDEYLILHRDNIFGPAMCFQYAATLQTALELNRHCQFLPDEDAARLTKLSAALTAKGQAWLKHQLGT